MSLPSEDSHHLEAATGYWELGMPEEALAEIIEMSPEGGSTVEARQLRLCLLMELCHWEEALHEAGFLCRLPSEQVEALIKAAYCLHELKRTREAKELLLAGPCALLDHALYHYNMACYECQLGHLTEARQWLKRAMEMDPHLLKMSRDDDDLEPLWQQDEAEKG